MFAWFVRHIIRGRVAAVVLAEGQAVTYQELLDHCRTHLAGFKCPKDMVVLAQLPRNPSGKVLKRALRELDAAGSLDVQGRMNQNA